MTSSTLHKRPAPVMEAASPPCKKIRTELSSALPVVPKDELSVDISPFSLDFTLSDLPYDFVHPTVNTTDLRPTSFDNWLEDPPLDVLPVTEAFSDISSDESKPNPFVPLPPLSLPPPADSHQHTVPIPIPAPTTTSTTTGPSSHHKLPSSPVNSECALRTEPVSTKPTTANATTANSKPSNSDIESHKKRQADRAARNRESSRRAREKQKNRFIQLQNGNMLLQQTLQRYKLQVEHLKSSLDRMHAMLSSCSMCSYNVTLVQQQQQQQAQQTHASAQNRPAPNPSLLRQ